MATGRLATKATKKMKKRALVSQAKMLSHRLINPSRIIASNSMSPHIMQVCAAKRIKAKPSKSNKCLTTPNRRKAKCKSRWAS